MAQELTFNKWVENGFRFHKGYDANFYTKCLFALRENMHSVVSKSVETMVSPLLELIEEPILDNTVNEKKMLESFSLLCDELVDIRKSEENSAKIFSNYLDQIQPELNCQELIGHSKTALSMLSRYFRGYDEKCATQAEYIREIYRPHLDKMKSQNLLEHTEKIRWDELKFVFTDGRTRRNIKEALSFNDFKSFYCIKCIEIKGDEISFTFQEN